MSDLGLAFVVSHLLRIEGPRIVAGLLLLYVAEKLVWDGSGHGGEAKPTAPLWSAVAAITVADVGTPLDNVLAIAALARTDATLLAIGIAMSVPLVIVGATVVRAVVDRLPIVAWFGAGLLGWVAIDTLNDVPLLEALVNAHSTVSLSTDMLSTVLGAASVLAVGVGRRLARRSPVTHLHGAGRCRRLRAPAWRCAATPTCSTPSPRRAARMHGSTCQRRRERAEQARERCIGPLADWPDRTASGR